MQQNPHYLFLSLTWDFPPLIWLLVFQSGKNGRTYGMPVKAINFTLFIQTLVATNISHPCHVGMLRTYYLSLAVKKLLTHTLNSPCCLLYSTFLGKVSIVSNGTTRYFFRGYAESPRMCYICKPSLSSLWPISLRRKIHASCMLPSQLTLISRKHMWLSQTAWMITDVNAFLFVYESSSCRAELYALLLAIDVVRRSKEKNFVIFTDSMSSLQSIYGFNLDIPMTL